MNIDDGRMGGCHWCAFYGKDNKSFSFDSFGGTPDENLLIQLTKPIIYHNYEIQDIYSKILRILLLILFLFN